VVGGGRKRYGHRCRAILLAICALVMFVVIDHDAQNVERILSLIKEREEVLYLLVTYTNVSAADVPHL
jgi:hypothetical protein